MTIIRRGNDFCHVFWGTWCGVRGTWDEVQGMRFWILFGICFLEFGIYHLGHLLGGFFQAFLIDQNDGPAFDFDQIFILKI